jgi:hypothetical protein
MEQPRVPDPQSVYGRIIFWLVLVAASINVIGPMMSITFPGNNMMNPQRVFSAIWQGNTPHDVWQQAGGGFPGGHFWVRNLDTWDGLTQFGIVIGCAGAFLALLATAWAFLRVRPPAYGWALVAFGASSMVLLSAIGFLAA